VFSAERRRAVVQYLATHPTDHIQETPVELQNYDDYVKIVILRAEKRYDGWAENDQYFEAAKLLRQYKTEHEKRNLEQQITAAEAQGDEAKLAELRKKHYELIKEMKRA